MPTPISLSPVAPQPPSTSKQFSLNVIDWIKIFRFMLVQLVGLFVTFGVPHLLSFRYVWKGTDYTAAVIFLVNGLAEAGRRFLQQEPKN